MKKFTTPVIIVQFLIIISVVVYAMQQKSVAEKQTEIAVMTQASAEVARTEAIACQDRLAAAQMKAEEQSAVAQAARQKAEEEYNKAKKAAESASR